ncbi:YihY family inner membrane protein [Paenalcaligenes niemegkensis]|uniref:YihY family inner membrane protein n=1 Tax=Paenalcaligenes niemegkensis TaxID=2895469 RepID=UPI001EE93CF3|nr:YihY family inner membrane protein [Paenalcaligenes niemegkensis]MCQ9616215.1 YihY family inner membrane protein [Paenalcaligenes niemegkensis]
MTKPEPADIHISPVQTEQDAAPDEPSESSWWSDTKSTLSFMTGRIAERRLTQVASSLTFTTILAIVPLLAVVLSLFTAFPLFNEFQGSLESFLTTNLMPAAVSETVMSYLNQFAAKASSLTAVGSLFLIVTSIMLISTIDETFNDIWLVTEKRPLGQRILVYWAIISLGPILAGASIWASSVVARESLGYIGDLAAITWFSLSYLPFLLTVIGLTALFAYVPNRQVLWRDALVGGLFTAVCLEILKNGFAFYLTKFPTYTLIYGTFATVPIFLMWMYLSWMVILLGASVAAILPDVRKRHWHTIPHSGAPFVNAVALLCELWHHQGKTPIGLSLDELSERLRRDPTDLSPVLKRLKELGYLANTVEDDIERWALTCDTNNEVLAPLIDTFLINRTQADNPVTRSMMGVLTATLGNRSLSLKQLFQSPETLNQLSESLENTLSSPLSTAQESPHAKSQ